MDDSDDSSFACACAVSVEQISSLSISSLFFGLAMVESAKGLRRSVGLVANALFELSRSSEAVRLSMSILYVSSPGA